MELASVTTLPVLGFAAGWSSCICLMYAVFASEGTIWLLTRAPLKAEANCDDVPGRPGPYPTKLTFAPVYPSAFIAAVSPGAVWKSVNVSSRFAPLDFTACTYGVKLTPALDAGMLASL